MRTFAMVLRSGGDVYGPDWVRKLSNAVWDHSNGWARHVVLTDVPEEFDGDPDLDAVPLEHDWPGWWSKLELFRPDVLEGHVLYLDLDTLVLGRIDMLWMLAGDLAMLSDFYAPRRPASGVMTWVADGRHADLHRAAAENGIGRPGRRMDHWLEHHVVPRRLQALWPDRLVSLKAHARQGPPKEAAVVCGHGKPRLSDPDAGWAHRHWMELRT